MECACLPTANTCATTLNIPVHINSLEDMTQKFYEAIQHTRKYGFGMS